MQKGTTTHSKEAMLLVIVETVGRGSIALRLLFNTTNSPVLEAPSVLLTRDMLLRLLVLQGRTTRRS